ncbi:hypothetical protein ACEUZ9_000759 [Paracoccus litorisediminis]|uniref:hypothetical protein n=1 Tax=Paracoccus litorisediminis TaxID=2006130 RepID=UPI0037300228
MSAILNPKIPARLKIGAAAAAAATLIGVTLSVANVYAESADIARRDANAAMVIPTTKFVTAQLRGGQNAFMHGLADAHDDMTGNARGSWSEVDYNAAAQGFDTLYQSGYEYQAEHRLSSGEVRATLIMSRDMMRLSDLAIDNAHAAYVSIGIPKAAIDATILNGIFDAGHGRISASPAFDNALDEAANDIAADQIVAIDRLRDTVAGYYGEYFLGMDDAMAKSAADALLMSREVAAQPADPFSPENAPEEEVLRLIAQNPERPDPW